MGEHGGGSRGRVRPKGSIDALNSGSLRVRVYAGFDALSGRKLYLTEVIPAGPGAWARAERVREEFVRQVEAGRQPKTNATISQMLERYLDEWDGSDRFRETLQGYVRNHVDRYLGTIKAQDLDVEVLDRFYRELKRCRDHCDGRPRIRHRTTKTHDCDQRCTPHVCEGLGATTIRHIHFLLSGAYTRAKRWKWVTINPMGDAEPPAAPPPSPKPPTARQAALIINEAWRDPDWGTLVWLAMTTGARRGELCALRWNDLDLAPGEETLWISRAIKASTTGWIEGATKTHQQRRVALDAETVLILTEHRSRAQARAQALGLPLAEDAFVFSLAPDSSTFCIPDTISQRYDRMVDRLEITTSMHKLRHFSATELIRAGVDVRTVAGRIGHSGGGTTTLKVYAAFVSEADQRAAGTFLTRMPQRPTTATPQDRAKTQPQHPYQRLAATLHQTWRTGQLAAGTELTVKNIAAAHSVSVGTAHRAITLLEQWGVVLVSNGRPSIVLPHPPTQPTPPEPDQPTTSTPTAPAPAPAPAPARTVLQLNLLHLGTSIRTMSTQADPTDFATLEKLMLNALRRAGADHTHIGDYEMTVHLAGQPEPITTVVIAA